MAMSMLVVLAMTLAMDPDQSLSSRNTAADPEPAATRLFFAPTGRSLEAGSVYASAYQVMLPSAQIGVTDRFSIGAGAPIMAVAFDVPVWLTPKLQVVDRPSTKAAVGVIHFLNVGDGAFGVAYGVVTKGSADSALTVGGGYAYETFDGGTAPMLMIGGEHRIRRGVKLLTENYLLHGGGLAMGGVRLYGRHLSTDLGLGMVLVDGCQLPFPVVNVQWRF
jgi:hypothetical protein